MAKITKLVQQHLAQILKPYLTPEPNTRYPTLDRHLSTYFK